MKELEKKTEGLLLSLCNLLPSHVELWKTILKTAQGPVRSLLNFAEQLRFVEKTNLKWMDNFDETQQKLQLKILSDIEEELGSLQICIKDLDKANIEFKNKLSTLEKTTLELDWEKNLPLIQGSPIQPPLRNLLEMFYDVWLLFSEVFKKINQSYRLLNIRNEKSLEDLRKAFSLDFQDNTNEVCCKLNEILAITQYVRNKGSVC